MVKVKDLSKSISAVNAVQFRQNLGTFLNRVSLKQETFVIERDGTPLAAIVSIYDLSRIKEAAAEEFLCKNTKKSGSLTHVNLSRVR